MKTVVFQSYRTSRVAGWTNTCMASTKAWAESRGFDYRFFDDEFFELAPAWFRERCAGEVCPVTDLARLVAARDFLAAGYERTVWVDADVLVFAPEDFKLDVRDGFAFCLEVWGLLGDDGRARFEQRINNSVSVFTRGNRQLDFFIDACLRIGQGKERLHKLDVGTRFLTGLAALMPMPVLPHAGTLSPLLVNDIAGGEDRFVPEYARRLPQRLAAANLCGSLVGLPMDGAEAGEAAFAKTVAVLLESRGGVINRHVRSTSLQ
jgi:hypothetical protein